MALLPKDPLRPLSSEEQRTLERIAQATSERVDRVRRAQASRAVAQGQSLSQAARQAGWHHHSGVAKLVARFNRQGVKAVDIAPGRGLHRLPAEADFTARPPQSLTRMSPAGTPSTPVMGS